MVLRYQCRRTTRFRRLLKVEESPLTWLCWPKSARSVRPNPVARLWIRTRSEAPTGFGGCRSWSPRSRRSSERLPCCPGNGVELTTASPGGFSHACGDVVDRGRDSREVAVHPGAGRYSASLHQPFPFPQTLVVHHEEQLVASVDELRNGDRSAEGEAELVAPEWRLGRGRWVEEIARASKNEFRTNSHAEPWTSFVPPFVVTFT
jgi:hypothetical protein